MKENFLPLCFPFPRLLFHQSFTSRFFLSLLLSFSHDFLTFFSLLYLVLFVVFAKKIDSTMLSGGTPVRQVAHREVVSRMYCAKRESYATITFHFLCRPGLRNLITKSRRQKVGAISTLFYAPASL